MKSTMCPKCSIVFDDEPLQTPLTSVRDLLLRTDVALFSAGAVSAIRSEAYINGTTLFTHNAAGDKGGTYDGCLALAHNAVHGFQIISQSVTVFRANLRLGKQC